MATKSKDHYFSDYNCARPYIELDSLQYMSLREKNNVLKVRGEKIVRRDAEAKAKLKRLAKKEEEERMKAAVDDLEEIGRAVKELESKSRKRNRIEYDDGGDDEKKRGSAGRENSEKAKLKRLAKKEEEERMKAAVDDLEEIGRAVKELESKSRKRNRIEYDDGGDDEKKRGKVIYTSRLPKPMNDENFGNELEEFKIYW
ncbi:hypothetical protein Glove_301g7 [Diversispora epigaea]|uniref:Uncharacterized protein n=1 Tax=Diversispora epigaea TaxID=1348612 RepID=A0A397HVY5_9GLOM|nr:hypothetical protein Glove_301g7 [Diversispora epigaea]